MKRRGTEGIRIYILFAEEASTHWTEQTRIKNNCPQCECWKERLISRRCTVVRSFSMIRQHGNPFSILISTCASSSTAWDWLITTESHIFVFYTVAVHDTLTEYLTLSLGSTRSEGSRKSASDAGILLPSADLSEVRSLVKTSSSLLVQLVPWVRLGSSSSLAWFPFDDVALLRKSGGSRNCPIKEIADIL